MRSPEYFRGLPGGLSNYDADGLKGVSNPFKKVHSWGFQGPGVSVSGSELGCSKNCDKVTRKPDVRECSDIDFQGRFQGSFRRFWRRYRCVFDGFEGSCMKSKGVKTNFMELQRIFTGFQRHYSGVIEGVRGSQVLYIGSGHFEGISRKFKVFSASFRCVTEAFIGGSQVRYKRCEGVS